MSDFPIPSPEYQPPQMAFDKTRGGNMIEPLSPEGRARLDKYGSTLTEDNVRLLIERIEDYPEVIAAVLANRPDPAEIWQMTHDEYCEGGPHCLWGGPNGTTAHPNPYQSKEE